MRLAEYTDYTLRVLMYCAANPEGLVTIAELADRHGVSKNHLMKIVNDLSRQGVLQTTRGRGGGVRLARAPQDIRVGDVVRNSESDFRMVECFDARTNTCLLTASCRLKGVLETALQAYFQELDAVTLADLCAPAPGASLSEPVRGPLTRRSAAPPARSRTITRVVATGRSR